jgi:hypothetical protein
MVESPLAFDLSETRMICDAFDDAWASLQGLGSDLTEASKSLGTRTILAKRIIEMADQGLTDVPKLRDDALAFFYTVRLRADRKGLSSRSPGSLACTDSLNANVGAASGQTEINHPIVIHSPPLFLGLALHCRRFRVTELEPFLVRPNWPKAHIMRRPLRQKERQPETAASCLNRSDSSPAITARRLARSIQTIQKP